MSDFYDEPGGPAVPMTADPPAPPETLSETVAATVTEPQPATLPEAEEAKHEPAESPAVTRFKSCRWHEKQENASSYCANRDVLPFAGKNGFDPEAWCPDCKFYKVKRTVKKRTPNDWDDY